MIDCNIRREKSISQLMKIKYLYLPIFSLNIKLLAFIMCLYEENVLLETPIHNRYRNYFPLTKYIGYHGNYSQWEIT